MRRSIVVLGSILFVAVPAQGQELFSRKDYTLGATHPLRVIAIDVDGDGDLDLVAAGVNGSGGMTHVLLNSSHGTFTRSQTISTTGMAFSIAAADFDVDGDPDLAIGTGQPNFAVEIFDNQGGTYVAANSLPAPAGEVTGVVALDFDGDAVPDLAAAEQGDIINCTGALVRVRANVGGFGFTETGTYPTQCQPFDMTAGDFDGVNGVDLATADRIGGDVSVFSNDGSGGFSNYTQFAIGGAVDYLHAADFDSDGLDDIAVLSSTSNPTTPVDLMWSTGSGFTIQPYAELKSVGPIRSGDFDGDGDVDLVAAVDRNPIREDWVVVLRDTGSRTFSPGITQICGISPRGAVVADLDPSNPLPDIAVTGFGSFSVSVLRQTGATWPVLELSVNAAGLYPFDSLAITASNGAPAAPLLASVVTVNGAPSFIPIAVATFDGAGQWQTTATVPTNLSGLHVELAVFGFEPSGRLSASNWSELEFF